MSGSTSQPLVGYPGLVWGTCWQAMSWLSNLLAAPSASSVTIAAGAAATYATLRNGSNAVAAYQTAAALAVESANLIAISEMALSLDSITQQYFIARVNSTTAAASGIAALPPPAAPFAASGLLAAGQPAIADPMFLEWCMGFSAETSPTTFTYPATSPPPSTLPGYAALEATSWVNVANAVQVVEGAPYVDYRYDAAVRTYRTSNRIATILGQFQSGLFAAPVSGAWNTAAALPAILLSAASLMSAPNALGQQQASVVRYDLNAISLALSQLLLSLRSPNTAAPGLATLAIGQSLQDLAAISTGNFENWSAIAALNGISPPYPGATVSGLAAAGAQLLLPITSGAYVPGAPVPSYFTNILGTDWDFGPINGNQPPWLGDIPLITGYNNFARAIGRRIQTPLGTLIYHPTYGCRIPPEVGAVQGAGEAPKLRQYGDAAVKADPRTGSIVTSIATVNPGFLATYAASILPIGPGTQAQSINETISPLPVRS